MTIHQPSGGVFARLDDLYLLEQGRLAFAGSLAEADAYFRSIHFEKEPEENPADFYLDLINVKPTTAAKEPNYKGEQGAITEDTTWSKLYYGSKHVQDVSKLTSGAVPATDASDARVGEMPRFFTLFRKLNVQNMRGPVYRLRALQLLVLVSRCKAEKMMNRSKRWKGCDGRRRAQTCASPALSLLFSLFSFNSHTLPPAEPLPRHALLAHQPRC
jgi:hypothetical protein